jgi:hypothetical protein
MSEQELKDAVSAATQALNDAIAAARAGSVVVNLWVTGAGPTNTGPSEVGLDFGTQQAG